MAGDGGPESQRARNNHLRKAFSHIERVCSRLDLDASVINLAESTYKQYIESLDSSIKDIEPNAVACLYIAARINSHPITPDDIAEADPASTSRKSLLRRSKKAMSTLSLDIEEFHNSASFVDRICQNLNTLGPVESRAKEIIEVCDDAGINSGKKPAAIAAAAIYNASLGDCGVALTQKEISEAANVSTVTIRSRYQEQRKVID